MHSSSPPFLTSHRSPQTTRTLEASGSLPYRFLLPLLIWGGVTLAAFVVGVGLTQSVRVPLSLIQSASDVWCARE